MTDSADDDFDCTDEQKAVIKATPACRPIRAGAGVGKSITIRRTITAVTGYDPADEGPEHD